MALMTRAGMRKILEEMMDMSDMTGNEEFESRVNRLREDFEERENYLKNYGDVYEGDDKDEYEYVGRDMEPVYTPREEEKIYEQKYNDLKKKYYDRFFGNTQDDVEEIMEEQEENVKEDGEAKTFDELLYNVEG